MTHIAGSHEAFCALRADGSCFTWGGAKLVVTARRFRPEEMGD